MATSVLDLAGVLLIGLVGALSVATIQNQPPPISVTNATSLLGLESASSEDLILILALAAALMLLTKSIISSVLTRRVLVFLANRQALVSARLIQALLFQPLSFVQQRSTQETAYALTGGAAAATLIMLGQMVVLVTEAALLLVLALTLFLINPLVATGAIVFFVAVAFGLQKAMGGWASRTGRIQATADIESLNAIQEAIAAYREVFVLGRRQAYVEAIKALRWQAASVTADVQFIGMFPKYMFEAALVLGGFMLAAVVLATQEVAAAVGTIALFLAAATRIMPSILRLQGAMLGMRSAAGAAGPTFALASDLGWPTAEAENSPGAAARLRPALTYDDFDPCVCITGVSFTYPESQSPALHDITLHVPTGSSLALVGRSGSGKSTLADVILGVLHPDLGCATIGGRPAGDCARLWPGSIGYVPQRVALANATIRENVALGLAPDVIDDDLVWDALERAHLLDTVRLSPLGLDARIGEQGLRLSGGQRQRLGIARALYSRPKLLVLDEATSALDSETERDIADTLSNLDRSVTLLIIAHRLATVRHVDQVAYMEDGRIVAIGTFEELLRQVPSFASQASLLGLLGEQA